jgi:hypothetical protein
VRKGDRRMGKLEARWEKGNRRTGRQEKGHRRRETGKKE